MKKWIFICCIFLCGCKEIPATWIRIPVTGIADYSEYIGYLLQEHPEGNLILEFEPGVYPFYPEKASGKYISVSNNDNSYKCIAFLLEGMENVSIRGDKTEFLFHGAMVPFYLNECRGITLSGISIDYDSSFILEGEVVGHDPASRGIDLKFAAGTRYVVRGTRLFFKGYDWEEPLGQNIVFDPSTHAPFYYTSRYLHPDWQYELTARELEGGVVRLSGFNSQELPPIGSIYIDKGPYKCNRLYPGIIIHSSKDIALRDMNMYMAGGMALIGETSENISMERFDVKLREGSGRYISASADATHFVNCKGTIRFRECLFENMLDDATNVHGTYMKVESRMDDDCIGVAFGHWQQQGFNFASAGDTLQVINRKSLLPVETFRVKEVEWINEGRGRIRADRSLSFTYADEEWAIENLSNTASLIMQDCIVRNNRARSILISTPKPVLIENNYFDSMMAGILIAGDANSWYESGNVSEVVIRNNTFINLGKGGEAPQSVLQISPEIPPHSRREGYYHGKILFENNVIKTFDSQVIYALSVAEITIRNNRFQQSTDYDPIFPGLSYIDLQHCKEVHIDGNRFEGDREVEVSTYNCEQVNYTKQKGFYRQPVNKPNTFFYQQ